MMDLIQKPFGFILNLLYQLTNSYGWALILFAIVVRLILTPATAKSKKNTMKMSRLQPQIQFLQKKYANDQQKLGQAMQELYKAENVSMGAGCLWSLVPLLLLFPLYAVVRQPITYMLFENKAAIKQFFEAINEAKGLNLSTSGLYDQMTAAPLLKDVAEQIKGIAGNPRTLDGISFMFLKEIDLSQFPIVPFTKGWTWTWGCIGNFLMPVLSAGSQIFSMLVSQKLNDSLITNDKGLQDKETAKNSQAAQTTKYMMFMMPIMSLIIGFSLPAALSLYWLASGLFTTFVDVLLTKKYRKIYDAEDASKLRKALQEEEAEMERERIRAERRAANPDGITQNTSKKKLQQAKLRELEAEKAAAQKEYEMKKGTYVEEEDKTPKPLSGIAERPFCKGRAYVADRYSCENTEE